jgi:hypothetical protein
MKGYSEAFGKDSPGLKVGSKENEKNFKPVNRQEITSQIMYHDKGNNRLYDLAGSHAGTTGNMSVSELLPGIVSHLGMALQIHKSEPFPAGQQFSVGDTQDAIALYEKFASIDYHFSKAHCYTKKLKEIVDTLDEYMNRNTITLRYQWTPAKEKIKAEIDRQFSQ